MALIVVAVDPVTEQVMPPPFIVTAVAPLRLLPFKVTGTVVLCNPVVGEIEVNVAPCTVKGKVPVFPPGTTTVTLWLPSPAVVVMLKVAVI